MSTKDDIIKRMYQRVQKYSFIHDLADDSHTVANPAYEEFLVSFVEMVYKMHALADLEKFAREEPNDSLRLKLAMLFLPYDMRISEDLVQSCLESDIPRVRTSANNLIGKMDDQPVNSYRNVILRVKEKISGT